MAPYTVSIRNKSGSQNSYAIFSEVPRIKSSGASNVKVTTRIIMTVQGVATGQGQASFILSKQLFATCGTDDVDSSLTDGSGHKGAVGTGTEVVDLRPVQLGQPNDDGRLNPGTTLEINCRGSPSFSTTEPGFQDDGEVDSFAVRTTHDFTYQQASLNKYFVGFCSSVRQTIGPYATFVPGPSQVYQIKPSKVFYVTVGEHSVRDLVPESLKTAASTCRVDFGDPAMDDVQLVHNDLGELKRVAAASNEPVKGRI